MLKRPSHKILTGSMRPHYWDGFINVGLVRTAACLSVGPRAAGGAPGGGLLSSEPLTTPALCRCQGGETEVLRSASLHASLMKKNK